MKLDLHKSYPSGQEILRLEEVSIAPELGYDYGMQKISLALHPGAFMMVLLDQGAWNHPLPDLVSGLIPVEQGRLTVFQQTWSRLTPDQQSGLRGKIGRVFEGHGWLSNLDIDENITLAQRHHTLRPVEEIIAESEALARQVGLEMIPRTRVAVTPRESLRRAEWIRAAIGLPWLVILERPGCDLAEGWMSDLVPVIDRIREQGSAVIWLCETNEEWNHHFRKPVLKFRAEANTLEQVQAT